MIGQLRGQVVEVSTDTVLIDVQGVGYEVHAPAGLLGRLSVGTGEPVTLVIETVVREDLIRLYGFSGPTERAWFRLLQSVQGVGARVALALLSVLSPEDLARAVAQCDHATFARAQGVGPKLAKRLATELKDKAPMPGIAVHPAAGPAPVAQGPHAEAVSALTNLGYNPAEAAAAIKAAGDEAGDGAALETLIRLGLRRLSV